MIEVTPIGTIGGEGHWLLAISWATTGAAAVCFFLRLYTRLAVVKSYGWDDTIYNASFALLLACTIMVHVSTLYGLGQSQDAIWADSHDRLTKCLLYLIIAQIFGVSTMGTAKVSSACCCCASSPSPGTAAPSGPPSACCSSTRPSAPSPSPSNAPLPRSCGDKTIATGKCALPITPFAIALGAGCVAADLFFALFPWLFVWQLNRPSQERLIIAVAMSLGLAAAACGVKRTIDSIPTCAWSIAELAITLVCIAIPVCLPLFKHILSNYNLPPPVASEASAQKPASPGGVFALRTFGGSSMPGSKLSQSWPRNSQNRDDAESEFSLRRPTSGCDTKNTVQGIDVLARPQSRLGQGRGCNSEDVEKQTQLVCDGAYR
ncbi:hypothetical protein PG994_012794 [Apiospora phragmitis]|uniref:Rhodopsin domain-containing protein n=1 Tax=Apiospora phragmitis TaxID=2905665 RepID=A0ABR1TD89_9PEZI